MCQARIPHTTAWAIIRGFPRAEDRVDEHRDVAGHAPTSSSASIGADAIRADVLGPGVSRLAAKIVIQ